MTMVYDKAKATVQYTVSNEEAEMIQEDNAILFPSQAWLCLGICLTLLKPLR